MSNLVLIGNPDSERVKQSVRSFAPGFQSIRIIPYIDLLRRQTQLADHVNVGDAVRIESPGKDFLVEKEILALGAEGAASEGWAHALADEALLLHFDRGRIYFPRQWYLGFCKLLNEIEQELARCPKHFLMNHPRDIATMFDKADCHALMSRQIPMARPLGIINSAEHLSERLAACGMTRAFLKVANSSSASGIAAFRTNGRRQQLETTMELVRVPGGIRLYNTRRVQVYDDSRDIADIVNEMCRHKTWGEEWLPKARLGGRMFDLRVVVIGQQARHVIARRSATTFTNLHLLNERLHCENVKAQMSPDAWQNVLSTCERAMKHFPSSLYAGIDLLVRPNMKMVNVLEVNAFGDQLNGVLYDNMDTYTCQLQALQLSKQAPSRC